MIRNETTKIAFFENLVWNQREKVVSWLRFKYNNLSYADAEDIFQDASFGLWEKFCKMNEWNGESIIGMLKAICRNTYGHWLRKHNWSEEWDDRYYPTDDGIEVDYGYISSEEARMLLKEKMYEMIETLQPKDRSLMEMHLKNVRMDEIARQLGFRNAQVARNRKSKIVVKLCKEINAQALAACASFFPHQEAFFISCNSFPFAFLLIFFAICCLQFNVLLLQIHDILNISSCIVFLLR